MHVNITLQKRRGSTVPCSLFTTAAFTLLELLLVMVIIAIIMVVGTRTQTYSEDAKRYTETLAKMRIIRDALIGNPELSLLGQRTHFGYVGYMQEFPAAAATNKVPDGGFGAGAPDLNEFLPPVATPSSYSYYQKDAWGNDFYYNVGASDVTLTCYGKDGVDDTTDTGTTIFDYDMSITVTRSLYENNALFINVMDANGTVLRGSAAPYDHQIKQLDLVCMRGVRIASTDTGSGLLPSIDSDAASLETISYEKGLFSVSNIPVGQYLLYVHVANGSGGDGGVSDHTQDLLGSENYAVHHVTVYPKGPTLPNFVEIRLPGKVDATKL